MRRPDLSSCDIDVKAYIEYLESKLAVQRSAVSDLPENLTDTLLPPDELPTSICVITATSSGVAKRTYRHLYSRQHRGGMGVFDLDCDEMAPSLLAIADETQTVLLLTSTGRAFRLPVTAIPNTEIRGRGEMIVSKPGLHPDETIKTMIPVQAQGYLTIVSESGMVRSLRHHFFGEHMKNGTALYEYKTFGDLSNAVWTTGEDDVFIATKSGKAIRFSDKLIPPAGGVGIRLSDGDRVVAIASVRDDSGVFLIGKDGKGTVRLMSGFTANKSAGGGGKTAINTDALVDAQTVRVDDDIFIISKQSKLIRFQSAEVPQKDGVVHGVNCMNFRNDEAVAMVVSSAYSPLI